MSGRAKRLRVWLEEIPPSSSQDPCTKAFASQLAQQLTYRHLPLGRGSAGSPLGKEIDDCEGFLQRPLSRGVMEVVCNALRLVSGASSGVRPLMLVSQHRTPLPEGQHILLTSKPSRTRPTARPRRARGERGFCLGPGCIGRWDARAQSY